MSSSMATVLLLTSIISTVYAPGVGDDGTYFQYMNVLGKYEYNFGFNRGNSEHSVSRYEQSKGSKFRSKVQWSDKHGGSGEQYWEYNHVDKGRKKEYGKGSIASYPPVTYTGSYGSSFGSKGSLGNSYGSLGNDLGGLVGGVHSGFGDSSLGSLGGSDYASSLKSDFGGLEGGIKSGFGGASLGGLGGNDYGGLGGGLKSSFGSLEGGVKSGFGGASLGNLGGADYGGLGGGLKSSFGGMEGDVKNGFGGASLGILGGNNYDGLGGAFGGLEGGTKSGFGDSSLGGLGGSDFGTGGGFGGLEGGVKSGFGDISLGSLGGNDYGGLRSGFGTSNTGNSFGGLGSDFNIGSASNYGDLGSGTLGGGFNQNFGSNYGSIGNLESGLQASYGGLESGDVGGNYGGFPGVGGGFGDHGSLGGFPALGGSDGIGGSYDFSGGGLKAGLGNSYGGGQGRLPGIGGGLGSSFGNPANSGVKYKSNYDSIASGSSVNKVKNNEIYYDRPGGNPVRTSVVKLKGNVGNQRRPPSSFKGGRNGVSKERGKHGGSNKYDSSQRIKAVVVKGPHPAFSTVKPSNGSTWNSTKQGPYEGVVYDYLGSESSMNNKSTRPTYNNQTHSVNNYGTFLSGYGKNSSTRNTRFRSSYHAPTYRHFPSVLDHKDQAEPEEINQEGNEEEDYGEELNDHSEEEEYDTSNSDAGESKEVENHEETEEEKEQSMDEEDPR